MIRTKIRKPSSSSRKRVLKMKKADNIISRYRNTLRTLAK